MCSAVTLSAKDNQRLSKHFIKLFERSIWMNIKQKGRSKIQQTNTDILLNQTLWELTDCLFWFIQTKMVVLKDLMAISIFHQQLLPKIITSLSTERTFTTNPSILI